MNPRPSRGANRSGTERIEAVVSGRLVVASQAPAMAASIRAARTGRLAAEPSLYLPAVTLPLQPEAYSWRTSGSASCLRRRAIPMKSADTSPRP